MAKKANAAFMKPVQPDAILAAIIGSKPVPRTEMTKKLWAYIKEHDLQVGDIHILFHFRLP